MPGVREGTEQRLALHPRLRGQGWQEPRPEHRQGEVQQDEHCLQVANAEQVSLYVTFLLFAL